VVLAAIGIALSSVARAADTEPDRPGATQSNKAIRAGAFLPWTMGARSDSQRALVYGQGGYDGARGGAVFQTVVEAQVMGRLALRAGASYLGAEGQLSPEFGLRVDALRQQRHGVDLALLGGYEDAGFNTVRAATARVALSRAFDDTRLVSNLGYGLGLDQGERYGDVRLAGIHPLTRALHVGLDSRFRIDLERDGDEPGGEPDWELAVGPMAAYSFGRYVVTATAGFSALKFRLAGPVHLGAIANAGLGAVF
jgi:hypothetical protein